jgi:hypothetical protein
MAVPRSSGSISKDEYAEYVSSEMERYEKAHSDRLDEAKKIYDFWLNTPPAKENTWNNAVHVPLTFEAEQTITPRIHSALFPSEAPVEMAVFGETPEEQGIIIRDHIRHHFRISNIQDKSILPISQATLLGTGYAYLPYVYKTGYSINSRGERELIVTDNRPDFEPVDFFELYPHPSKLEIDDGLPIIRKRFCDAEYLKRLSKIPQFKFSNLDKALQSECPVSGSTGLVDANGADLKKREKYEILEYWGPWDETYKKDDGEPVTKMAVPYWIMVVNRCVTIRAIPNPYNHQTPPFCRLKLYEDVSPSWFGIGMGRVGKPCQERVNKIVNQRLDNVDLVLNRQGFYNGNDPLINTKQLEISRPGKWHRVSDTVSSIRWMDTPDVTASSYKEEEIAKSDYRESTGATVPLMPTDEGQHSTASGINLLQGAAGIRFRPILRRMETDLVGRTAFVYLSNLQQFMSVPEWIKISSKDGKTQPFQVLPSDIQAKVKFIPTGLSEVMNKEMTIGQLMRFKELTQNDPTINRAYMNKKIAELLGLKDIDQIIIQQRPVAMGPGQMPPDMQAFIHQRLQEGASPEQVKLELAGQPPAMDGATNGQMPMDGSRMGDAMIGPQGGMDANS